MMNDVLLNDVYFIVSVTSRRTGNKIVMLSYHTVPQTPKK